MKRNIVAGPVKFEFNFTVVDLPNVKPTLHQIPGQLSLSFKLWEHGQSQCHRLTWC